MDIFLAYSRETGQLKESQALVRLMKEKSGIVLKKPLGAYLDFDRSDNPSPDPIMGSLLPMVPAKAPVLLVPVVDKGRFLKFLEQTPWKINAPKDGVYSVDVPFPPGKVCLRFENGYVYIAPGEKTLAEDSVLLTPANVFDDGMKSIASVTLHVDRVPKQLRQTALALLENQARGYASQNPLTGEAQRKLPSLVADHLVNFSTQFLKDGRDARFSVDMPNVRDVMDAELVIRPHPDTSFAKILTAMDAGPSLFGSFVEKKSALTTVVNLQVPQDIRNILPDVIEETWKQNIKSPNDKTEGSAYEGLYKSILPTVRRGRLDLGVFVVSPIPTTMTVLAGVKGVEGKTFGKEVGLATKDLPEHLRKLWKLNAIDIPGMYFHKVEPERTGPKGGPPSPGANPFGPYPTYLGFKDNGAFLGAGINALNELHKLNALSPKAAPLAYVSVDIRSFVEMTFSNRRDKDLVRRLFAINRPGYIRATLSSGSDLRLNTEVDFRFLRFYQESERAGGPSRPGPGRKKEGLRK
ncbi:MAG: hypothetical protein ACFCD0_21735 [Gemmataceae bacterium]